MAHLNSIGFFQKKSEMSVIQIFVNQLNMLKRKTEIEEMQSHKREESLQVVKPIEPIGVGGDHLAWDIIITKLDYQSQMKISQQNQRLEDVVTTNAEYELRKLRRHIQENKYM